MARRYSVKSRNYKKANWSRENYGFQIAQAASASNGLYQGGQIIVAPVTTQGERTIGHFTITVPVPGASASEVYWALVYIPQGTTANTLFSITGDQTGSLYEPNQFVIASGVSDATAGPIRITSHMKRKLHSGDSISLIIGTVNGIGTVRGLVSYAVKYN